MIAVDANILVDAHREDSPWHGQALARLSAIANSGAPWAIAWPSIHEFLAIVTHPRIYDPPTPLHIALNAL
jgi:predicted nucleic acid-binding protein